MTGLPGFAGLVAAAFAETPHSTPCRELSADEVQALLPDVHMPAAVGIEVGNTVGVRGRDLCGDPNAKTAWVFAGDGSLAFVANRRGYDPARPDDLRAAGWAVACHNDYTLGGEAHTFWLFTRGTLAVRGEGKTDAEALDHVRGQIRDAGLGLIGTALAALSPANRRHAWRTLCRGCGDVVRACKCETFAAVTPSG